MEVAHVGALAAAHRHSRRAMKGLEYRRHGIEDAAEPAARALARKWDRRLGAAALGDRGRLPRLEQRVAVAVPGAARIVVAEHRRGALRFLGEAERQIALGQAMQR